MKGNCVIEGASVRNCCKDSWLHVMVASASDTVVIRVIPPLSSRPLPDCFPNPSIVLRHRLTAPEVSRFAAPTPDGPRPHPSKSALPDTLWRGTFRRGAKTDSTTAAISVHNDRLIGLFEIDSGAYFGFIGSIPVDTRPLALSLLDSDMAVIPCPYSRLYYQATIISAFSQDEKTQFQFTACDQILPTYDLPAIRTQKFEAFVDEEAPVPLELRLGPNGMLMGAIGPASEHGAIAGIALPDQRIRLLAEFPSLCWYTGTWRADGGNFSISGVFERPGHRGRFDFRERR
jgi:hypothetical protein